MQDGYLASTGVTSPVSGVNSPESVVLGSVESDKTGTASNAQMPCTTPRSSKQTTVHDDVFQTKDGLLKYLEEHLGSGMAEIKSGNYSQEARRSITSVTASKMRDIYGPVPSSNAKLRVAVWLGDITKLESTSFFDPKTHKCYLNKALKNKRRSNPDQKCWSWSKRLCTAPKPSTLVSVEPASDSADFNLDSDRDGCQQDVRECEFCEGQLIYIFNVFCTETTVLLR